MKAPKIHDLNKSQLEYVLNSKVQSPLERMDRRDSNRRDAVVSEVTCVDGTTISVQASETHYCVPRSNDGGWTHVDVGYPSVRPPDSWAEYAEEWDTPTETVYGYVPIELVREYIELHGGENEI